MDSPNEDWALAPSLCESFGFSFQADGMSHQNSQLPITVLTLHHIRKMKYDFQSAHSLRLYILEDPNQRLAS